MLSEAFVTVCTFVWLLSCVTVHVDGQATAMSKLFVTQRTHVNYAEDGERRPHTRNIEVLGK